MTFLLGLFVLWCSLWAVGLFLCVFNALFLVTRKNPEKFGQGDYDEM
jgi:hypothetical protein